MQVKIKMLSPRATLPEFATEGSACFDLYACMPEDTRGVAIRPGQAVQIDTCLAVEIPVGYSMDIFSRSGHGFKYGIRLVNGVGIIDSDYRGPVAVKLRNEGTEAFVVNHGDRIAQARLTALVPCEFLPVRELTDTARGVGGFGSTGR